MERVPMGRMRRVPDQVPANWNSRPTTQRASFFQLGKLQIAAILLFIVFIWGLISAIAYSMYEIDPPALTEFEDDGKGDVSGFVTDQEGRSLENVTVSVHGTQHFTRTNEDGFYSMKNIREGDYEIEASLEEYGSITKKVSIDAHKPGLVDFMLEEGGEDKTINERYGSNLSDLRNLNRATAAFIIIYGIMVLIGGILAYLQRYFWIAMFGSLCGIFSGALSIGLVIAPILCIIALILIIRNKHEFIISETSPIDRLFGAKRATTRPVMAPKIGVKKPRPYGEPFSPKLKAMKPSFGGKEYPPPDVPSSEDMEPEGESELIGEEEPQPVCVACGGKVKSEAQGIVCQCGAHYHKFCATSVSVCKSCGEPL